MDIHWTGRTIPSGQRILMANLDMSDIQCPAGNTHNHVAKINYIQTLMFDSCSFVPRRSPTNKEGNSEEHCRFHHM